MMIEKRWLILSHGFNMDGRAASQTVTDKIPFLLGAGIKPVVFSAITGIKDQRFPHFQYLAWGPSAFRFDFRHWLANQYGRKFLYKILTGILSIFLAPLIALEKLLLGYSSQWSWSLPAFINGVRLIRSGRVDLVYSTGGAWSAHLAGLWLKKITGVKWIVEIHDPLVIRNGPPDQGFGKPRNRDARFRQYLEKQIVTHADCVWWFTDGAMHYAKVRNPSLNKPEFARGFVILPGANPPTGLSEGGARQNTNTLNLCHFGSLAQDRSLSTILNSVVRLLKKYPEARQCVRIHAYGAPLDRLTEGVIKQFNFEDILISHGRLEKDPLTGRSGRERVVEKMQKADVLILLHGNEEWCAEYIPSKFYEYLWTNRPIWGITHRNPQLDQMLLERNAYVSHQEDQASIDLALERIWLDWSRNCLATPIGKPIDVDQAVATILKNVYSPEVLDSNSP